MGCNFKNARSGKACQTHQNGQIEAPGITE